MTNPNNPSRFVGRQRSRAASLFFVVLISHMFAQSTTPPANTTANKPAAGEDSGEGAIVLSPFEVKAAADTGYFAANTLAGTRLNNNIADLPSSITVVTKQQLEDTASVDINDVFRYEANTEGARTYTPFALVRGNLQDGLGGGGGTTGNYTSALATGNRVRGLSAADQEQDNFFSLYRIPFDSYNTQAIEILRGPNSIIFGTGSPAGIVNQERSKADPSARVSGDVTLTARRWGGYRESFGANVPLIKDRLAIYVAQLYDSKGFKQKPSEDITRRQYATVTAYPFKSHKTKFTAGIEYYDNYANDPNGISPIDYVTPWLKSGRPVWNPVDDTVTYLDTNKVVGPYALSNAYPNYVAPITQANLTTSTSPYFVPSLTFLAANHRTMFVNQGVVENVFNGGQGPGSGLSVAAPALASMTNAQKLIYEARLTLTTNLPTPSQYATWYQPGVTSKSIYDWSNININSLSNTWTRATTYNAGVDQEILSNLHLQVAWFRQELKQIQDAPLAQASATTLYVDTNSHLLDGRANPHVGQPFVDVYASDVYSQPETNNNWRAMLDFEPDFRQHVPHWLDWIGHHRLMALFTQHDDVSTALRYRPAIDGGDANYLPTAAALANPAGYSLPASNSAIEQWFYLGGSNGQAATSPGFFNRPGYGGPTTVNIETYNYSNSQWATSQIHMDSLLFATGGLNENLQESKTFFWQSFFWDDRIVGSFGVNQDKVKNRSTLFPSTNPNATLFDANGFPKSQYWYVYGPWSYVTGTTHTYGVVAHPFKGWRKLDGIADRGNYVAKVLRTLSFTFNKSDNFNPPPAHYTDYFGHDLGKPQGKETDYGVEIATPDNKLFLRATWFKTTNVNALVASTAVPRANYIDQTELKNWATKVVEVRNGQNPSDPNFGNINVHPITPAMQDQIAALTGLPYNYGGNVGETGEFVALPSNQGTEDGVARGIEIEATYNPLPNWTMKLSWGKQETTITGAAAIAQAWVDHRMPKWQQYVASDLNTVYTLSSGSPMYLGNFWQAYGFDTNVSGPGNINGWTNTQNYYTSAVASQLAIEEANNGTLAPNQREYSWTYLTNYTIDHGSLKHVSFGGAVTYDGRATAGYWGSTTNLNANGQIAAPDTTRPIYTPGKFHLDAWVAYTFDLPWTHYVKCKVQFNVQDITSNGYLLPVTYNFDGSPAAQRIIQPRSYTLTAKFLF